MISRNILTEKTNESKRTETVQKSQRFLNTQKNQQKQDDDSASNFYQKSNTLVNNKITIRRCVSNKAVIRPNLIQQRQVNQASKVKIVPSALNFQSVQSHQMYEIPFFIRNQSTELQKVRIIPPLKKQFKIKYNQNFENQIAAGLAVKISVMFCSEQSFEMAEDRIIVMGNSFKHEVQLTAHCPRAVFEIPKIINLNSIFIKQQKQILIPVTNSGHKPGILSIEDIKTTQYCPNISYPTKSITILPNKQEYLELMVKPVTLGQTQINISFSNMEKCAIKCLVVEDMVDIVDQQGNKVLIKDFCEVFVGEKVQWDFFVANYTENPVDCIMQTVNRKKEQADIKIDKKRNLFIAEISPQQFSASVESSCFSLQHTNLSVKPFKSQKNTMYVHKIPSKQEIEIFVQNSLKNIQSAIYKAQRTLQNNSLTYSRDPNQLDFLLTGRSNNKSAFQKQTSSSKIFQKDKVINETLAIKFSNQQKITKIPIKFLSKIPNLQIDITSFQFGKLFIKQSQVKQFVLKNLSNKRIRLSFDEATPAFKENFKIEGPDFLEKLEQQKFKIKFRPLIKKKFAENVVIRIFDHFPIQIKVFGECLGLDAVVMRHQMSLTMTDRNKEQQKYENWKSLLKDRTVRKLTQIQNEQSLNRSLPKQSLVESSSIARLTKTPLLNSTRFKKPQTNQQIAQISFPLSHQNMTSEKQTKQSLFFNKPDYMKSTRKKKPFNHPSNIRQLLRYQQLTLQQLKKIIVCQKKLQFGHVFVGSRTSKKLTIRNQLQTPILVELDTQGAQSLSENNQEAIRVQGYATFEIDIMLHPTQLGQLELPLNYIVNKQHVFEIKILAMVTLVNLELSSRSFVFNFNEDDVAFQKEEVLQVFNNGNKKTRFFFEQPQNTSFKLSVIQGELQPKSYMNIKITYCPLNGHQSGQQRVDVEKLKMKVHQGAENIIKCTGTVRQPKISIKQTQFIVDNSIVSVPITNRLSIKNHSKVQTYVKIQFQPIGLSPKNEDIVSFFTIQNSIQPLAADEKKQITFNFLCHQVRKIQGNIVVSIRGYKVTKIPFSFNVIFPQVVSIASEIDFKDVPIMSNYCIEMFSLINTTQTQIKLEIDPSYPKDDYFCEILAVKDKNLEVNYQDEKYKTFLNSFMAAFKDNKRLSRRKSIICNKVLTLPPNGEESVFNLKFIPKSIKQYDFQIPLRVYGCVEKNIKPVNIQIKCNAVDPVIYVEPRALKFDTKVICQAKTSYSQSIFISNPHNYTVKFRIEPLMRNSQALSLNRKNISMTSTFNDKFKRDQGLTESCFSNVENFSFSQFDGNIEPNGKIEIFVSFKPTIQGEFTQKFNIFLCPKTQDSKYFSNALSSYILDVSGSAILPTLRFNCNEAIMPVVPLNLESRIFIMIQNHGYDAITICKWKTSNHFSHTQIKVNFIEGKLLSLAKKSLRIEILFSSLAPISFTTMLQLYDEYGNKYELPLSCTADNSIFTSFPYLQSDNAHTILSNSDERLIKLIATGKNPFYQQSKQLSGNHTMSCLFIQKWLNFQLNMSLKSYPESIIESDGKDFVRMINRISSKNLIKKNEWNDTAAENYDDQQDNSNEINGNGPKGKIKKILQLVQLYSQTIKKLKVQGAFLNHLRPQYLLNYSQFINYQNHKRKLVCSQSIFQVISVQSWIALFYQLCKIYIQPQITQKMLSKLKIQSSPVPLSNYQSNIYSPCELLLLKFINHHTFQDESSHNQQPVLTFTEQMKIFQVVQRILENNFKLVLGEQIAVLKNSVSVMSPHVFLSSIAKFLYTQLKEFGLSVYLGPVDLFMMGVKELVLYFINLLQMIYHYSNATAVKFQGAVGDKITKVIELQNPTTKKVNYFVKIVNSSESADLLTPNTKSQKPYDLKPLYQQSQTSSTSQKQSCFIPEQSQITIEPKQKAQLKIVYHCKNAKGETANLYLIPTKEDDDFTIPQPLLFKLNTSILSKIVMKRIAVNAGLYEVVPVHLEVELPSQIPESAEFSLSLYEQTPLDGQNNSTGFNPPSFIFNQSHIRTLKQGNKDTLQVKLVPLSMGEKMCKVSYFSSIYGQFIYQILAKVTNPRILKQFKIKDLKVNIQQDLTITIPKENQLLLSLLKVYYPEFYTYHSRTEKTIPQQITTKRNITSSSKLNLAVIEKASAKDLRYDVELLENQYVELGKASGSIEKWEGKEHKIQLKSMFAKPFKEYSVLLVVKNDLLKDRRLYKVTFVVISPPKIIKMHFKTPARQSITQKLPTKLAPCQITLKSPTPSFTIQNLTRETFVNTDLICHFTPAWIQQTSATIEIQNKESLEQIIYEISLKAEQPEKFATYELVGSAVFDEELSVPIDVQGMLGGDVEQNVSNIGKSLHGNGSAVALNQLNSRVSYQVKRLFKRPHTIQSEQFYPVPVLKSVKSFAGLKSNQSCQAMKESTDRHKVPKTKSMNQEKNQRCINIIFHPSQTQSETGSIRLCKQNSEEYYWAQVTIRNRTIKKLRPLKLHQKINLSKVQYLDSLLQQQGIDWHSIDFQHKFSPANPFLTFGYQPHSSSQKSLNLTRQKRPTLIFTPIKQTQTSLSLFIKSNNKEFMLPIQLKAEPLPTIFVPEITTFNVEAKTTYLNLINGTDFTGVYKVVVANNDYNGTETCLGFAKGQNDLVSSFVNTNSEPLTYSLKPKEKKQIKVFFKPKYIHQKQKFIVKFQSQTLPNYTYILNARSEFKLQQQSLEFEIYEDHVKPFQIMFANLFHRKEYFTIQIQGKDNGIKVEDCLKVENPVSKRFTLEEAEIKEILVAIKETYFSEVQKSSTQSANQDPNLKFSINIKVGQKIVKKYHLTLLIIKNLFSTHQQNPQIQKSSKLTKSKLNLQKQLSKLQQAKTQKSKNLFLWYCKARQTIYETIEIPSQLNFFVKEIKCPPEIQKYLTFTCICQNQESAQNLGKPKVNHLKIKYSPMKPLKKKRHDFILYGQNGEKYRIQCQIQVEEPEIDDTIVIKTSQIDQIGCVSFKLTNITKFSAKYKAYFVKKLPEFTLDSDHGTLEGYGKPGTPILVKFKSHINNRRLEDKLIIQTDDMYWCFKVKGMLSKDCHL